MKGLRKRLIITTCLICFLCIVVTGVVTYTGSAGKVSSLNQDKMFLLSENIGYKLNSLMEKKENIVDTLGRKICEIDQADNVKILTCLKDNLKNIQITDEIADVYFVTAKGEFISGFGHILEVADDLTHRPYFEAGKNPSKIYYTSPYCDLVSGEMVVTIGENISDKNGAEGVLCMDLYLDKLLLAFENVSLPQNSYYMILDSAGNIIHHPNSAFIPSVENVMNIRNVAGDPYHILWNTHDVDIEKRDFIYVSDYDDVIRGCTFNVCESNGWSVVLLTDQKELNSGIVSMLNSLAIAVVISIFIGLVLIFLLVKELMRPVSSLSNEVEIAESANKVKNELLNNMSHEIRTPINTIMGLNELMLRSAQDSATKEYALGIQQTSVYLLDLVNGILDYSKIESDQMEIFREEYEIAPMLKDIISHARNRAKEKKLEFYVKVQENIPRILTGDPSRIRQIMVRLLNNAIKFTENGYILCELSIENSHHKDEVVIRFQVKDTGIGIKDAEKIALIEKLENFDLRRYGASGGTGLGLAIVFRLARMMGGRISFESEYGKGTTFTFFLPQQVADFQPIGDFEQTFLKKQEEKEQNKALFIAPGCKLLAVDDNKMNLSVTEKLLRRTKMQITTCMSGKEALELMTKERFDIILMDHMMPGLDGIETLQRSKNMVDNLCKNVPVIVLTANAIAGARSKYLEAGFTDYLAKPIKSENLETMLAKYLPEDKLEYL